MLKTADNPETEQMSGAGLNKCQVISLPGRGAIVTPRRTLFMLHKGRERVTIEIKLAAEVW